MANIVRPAAHWKRFSTPPVVHLEHIGAGFEFREVEYGPGGSWDHATTRLHIAAHLDPIRQRIGGPRAPFLLVPPSAAVSAPGDRLAGSWEGSGRARHLMIAPDLVARFAGHEFASDLAKRRHFARVREPDAEDAIVDHLMSTLALDIRSSNPAGPMFLEMVVGALVQRTLRTGTLSSREPASSGGLPPGQLRRVLDAIEARLTGRPSLAELAAMLDVSTRYFSRAFRASTGQSPHQYVLRRRVERARGLIERGELSLSETAIAAGFADHSQMATTFRAVLRVPPSYFRRRPKSQN
jgi:AraC family transcriptional regulator